MRKFLQSQRNRWIAFALAVAVVASSIITGLTLTLAANEPQKDLWEQPNKFSAIEVGATREIGRAHV